MGELAVVLFLWLDDYLSLGVFGSSKGTVWKGRGSGHHGVWSQDQIEFD
jgi:hypothetical protein